MKRFCLGLTGSIGMGKSTTAAMFAEQGIAVWNADHAVHRLYAPGGAAVAGLAALFPQALGAEGGIDRGALRQVIAAGPEALATIEALVHPLVAADRAAFLAASSGLVVLDIPLLFEKGTEAEMDATLLVTASASVQRARVLARPGMTDAAFALILSRQMPDAEKRARATHIVETLSLDQTRAYVLALIDHIRSGAAHA